MIIDFKNSEVQSSEDFVKQAFQIKNSSFIFEILRNKMYTNPMLAICREISCNARDAHREVGTPDKPIEIVLPNVFSPSLKIKDYGPGISPNRMDIFRCYAESTKRNDNIQTGGFGLGAKTPFAYTDAFSVTTIVNGIKYNYTCYLDESRVGEIALLSKEETSEPNGTEIVIPIKKDHFVTFKNYVIDVTKYWDVKPLIFGQEVEYEEPFFLRRDYWAISSVSDYSLGIIVDGIGYDVSYNSLGISRMDMSGKLNLFFNVGEISLTVSRENINLDDKTKAAILSKMNISIENIKHEVQKELSSKPDIKSASKYFRDNILRLFDCYYNRSYKFYWNSLELSSYGIRLVKCEVTVIKASKRNNKIRPNFSVSDYIPIMDDIIILKNDSNIVPRDFSYQNVTDNNMLQKTIVIITPGKFVDKNREEKEYSWEEVETDNDFKFFEMESISKYYASTKAKKLNSVIRFNLFLFKNNSFELIAKADIDNKSKNIFVPLTVNTYRTQSTKSLSPISDYPMFTQNHLKLLYSYFKNVKVNIIGYIEEKVSKDKIIDAFDNPIFIKDVLEELAKFPKDKFIEIASRVELINNFNCDDFIFDSKSFVDDNDSVFIKFIDLCNESANYYNEHDPIVSLYSSLGLECSKADKMKWISDNQDLNLKLQYDYFKLKYPMIRNISFNSITLPDIFDYVNMVDEFEKIKGEI